MVGLECIRVLGLCNESLSQGEKTTPIFSCLKDDPIRVIIEMGGEMRTNIEMRFSKGQRSDSISRFSCQHPSAAELLQKGNM